ncbi:MAG: copper chaperone PCu(A)C [Pararhodobacter sp.]
MIRTPSLAAAAAAVAMPAFACDGFSVTDAYARSSTMMSQSGAAFMVFHNAGDADCRVVGARSDIAERTELHTHLADANGVMRMVEVEEGFVVPAAGEHALARGGDHVMFMGLNRPMEQGSTFELTLVFEDGSEFATEVTVDNERMPMQRMGQMHGHGQMHGQTD